MLDFLFQRLRRFKKDTAGNIVVIFALSLLPLTGLAGAAIDYSRVNAERMKLDNAADAAALAAVTKSARNNLALPDQGEIKTYFKAIAQIPPDVVLTAVNATPRTSVTSVFVTVSYTATMKTSFLAVLGFDTLTFGGSSTSATDKPKFVNFYLLLDNSPSMGLGATDADIKKLQSLTPDSCAFACHQHVFDTKDRIIGDSTTDYYTIAKNNNVTTRIDVLRSATKNLAQSAFNAQQMTSQFKMAVYTFSDQVQTISGLSGNLTTGSPNVKAMASGIDLAYAYKNQRDTQTSFDTAMTHINTNMPAPGDGSTSNQAMQFLFLVTDGVQDQPVGTSPDGNASGAANTQDPYDPKKYTPPNVVTQANLISYKAGNVPVTVTINGKSKSVNNRLITTMDTTLCDTVKNRNIRIAVLYTPYLPIPSNSFYNSYVAPLAPAIPTKLKACASPGFYFEVTPTQGIDQAMQAMFQAALSAVRLTQ
jgi:Flp pilus assembly protein TadG